MRKHFILVEASGDGLADDAFYRKGQALIASIFQEAKRLGITVDIRDEPILPAIFPVQDQAKKSLEDFTARAVSPGALRRGTGRHDLIKRGPMHECIKCGRRYKYGDLTEIDYDCPEGIQYQERVYVTGEKEPEFPPLPGGVVGSANPKPVPVGVLPAGIKTCPDCHVIHTFAGPPGKSSVLCFRCEQSRKKD